MFDNPFDPFDPYKIFDIYDQQFQQDPENPEDKLNQVADPLSQIFEEYENQFDPGLQAEEVQALSQEDLNLNTNLDILETLQEEVKPSEQPESSIEQADLPEPTWPDLNQPDAEPPEQEVSESDFCKECPDLPSESPPLPEYQQSHHPEPAPKFWRPRAKGGLKRGRIRIFSRRSDTDLKKAALALEMIYCPVKKQIINMYVCRDCRYFITNKKGTFCSLKTKKTEDKK